MSWVTSIAAWDRLDIATDRRVREELDSRGVPNAERALTQQMTTQARVDEDADRDSPRRRKWRR